MTSVRAAMIFAIVDGVCYPYRENKGADQLRSYCAADLRLCFRICQKLGFQLIFEY